MGTAGVLGPKGTTFWFDVRLPTEEELENIEGLDIACFMEPADEVGGDYYESYFFGASFS